MVKPILQHRYILREVSQEHRKHKTRQNSHRYVLLPFSSLPPTYGRDCNYYSTSPIPLIPILLARNPFHIAVAPMPDKNCVQQTACVLLVPMEYSPWL